MDDYFGAKGIQKEETKHTQSYSGHLVFDAQASLKNQKIALLVFLRGAFLGGIGTLLFNEFWYFLKMKVSSLLY